MPPPPARPADACKPRSARSGMAREPPAATPRCRLACPIHSTPLPLALLALQSKLANVVYTYDLAARLPAAANCTGGWWQGQRCWWRMHRSAGPCPQRLQGSPACLPSHPAHSPACCLRPTSLLLSQHAAPGGRQHRAGPLPAAGAGGLVAGAAAGGQQGVCTDAGAGRQGGCAALPCNSLQPHPIQPTTCTRRPAACTRRPTCRCCAAAALAHTSALLLHTPSLPLPA